MPTTAQSPLDITELLYLICTYVDCEDLLAFSSTSRRIHHIASPILHLHRRSWAKFQDLADTPSTAPWFWHKVALGLLVTNNGASYVRHIKMGGIERRVHRDTLGIQATHASIRDWDLQTETVRILPSRQPQPQLRRQRRHGSSAVSLDAVTALASGELAALLGQRRRCIWLSEDEQAKLAEGLRSGQQPFIRALLLPLLPNLKTLKIEWSSSSVQQLLGAAVRHAAIAHSLLTSWGCTSFGKLAIADFTTDGQIFDSLGVASGREYTLDFLSLFMSLPRMRILIAQLVIAPSFTRIDGLAPPVVTDLALTEQDIAPAALCALLADSAPLQCVKLGVVAHPRYFDDGAAITALLSQSQTSLIHLELVRTSNVVLDVLRAGIKLQHFTNLASVVVNYECFRIQGAMQLAALLPTSLQRLELLTMTAQLELLGQILHMIRCIALFPRWSELCVHGWMAEEDKARLRGACAENGISLSVRAPGQVDLDMSRFALR